QPRRACGAARPGERGRQRSLVADAARARDRDTRHRTQDEPRDRERALPQREDDRGAHAPHLRQARRLVSRRGSAGRRTRAGAAAVTSLAPKLDPDAARLEELGYRQELARRLHIFDNAAMGFAAISPVVGLYA